MSKVISGGPINREAAMGLGFGPSSQVYTGERPHPFGGYGVGLTKAARKKAAEFRRTEQEAKKAKAAAAKKAQRTLDAQDEERRRRNSESKRCANAANQKWQSDAKKWKRLAKGRLLEWKRPGAPIPISDAAAKAKLLEIRRARAEMKQE